MAGDNERIFAILPAAGGLIGGTAGALRPSLVDVGRGGGWRQRLMGGLLGAGTGATLGWLPEVTMKGVKAMKRPSAEKVVTASAQRGKDLVQYMWDELEKISEAPTAWELGIRAKRGEDPQGRLAVLTGTTGAGVTGAASAIPTAFLVGATPYSLLTQKGRKAAKDIWAEDIAKVKGVLGGEKALQAEKEVREAASKSYGKAVKTLLRHGLAGPPPEKPMVDAYARAVEKILRSPELEEVVSRRAKAALKPSTVAATALGLAGLKGLLNVAEYNIARAATKEKRSYDLGAEEAQAESPGNEPIAEILGTQVELLDTKRARGFPLLPAPPGYVFAPELQAYVPDMGDGWMPQDEAEAAQAQMEEQQRQEGVLQEADAIKTDRAAQMGAQEAASQEQQVQQATSPEGRAQAAMAEEQQAMAQQEAMAGEARRQEAIRQRVEQVKQLALEQQLAQPQKAVPKNLIGEVGEPSPSVQGRVRKKLTKGKGITIKIGR